MGKDASSGEATPPVTTPEHPRRAWMRWAGLAALVGAVAVVMALSSPDSDRSDRPVGFAAFKVAGLVCLTILGLIYRSFRRRYRWRVGPAWLWHLSAAGCACCLVGLANGFAVVGIPFPPAHTAWGLAYLWAIITLSVGGWVLFFGAMLPLALRADAATRGADVLV